MSSIILTGLIGLAGALGAAARYLLSRFVVERAGDRFPFGTSIINISGAFLIGLVFTVTTRHLIATAVQSVLATGFLGGYTTFSTMSWEGFRLIRAGRSGASLLYLGGSAVLGLAAVALGFAVGWVL